MSLRAFFRKIAGRAGNASRSKRGANSHVNTKRNKRAASKAVRSCSYAESDPFAFEQMMHELPIEFLEEEPTQGDKE